MPRVLSIQSHMVSGYCGNKAATFPLQTLGFDVDVMNTVQFSNHTGYSSWAGSRLSADDIEELFKGMTRNGLTSDYTHMLTGYIGNYRILETIKAIVKEIKSKSPHALYICDPVMGDDNKLYVAEEIIPLYQEIFSLADVITPNQFEAEVLTKLKADTLANVRLMANALHDFGVPNVIITSVWLHDHDVPASVVQTQGRSLYCMTSQRHHHGDTTQHLLSFPTYEGYFTGTGDLFSALVVAWFTPSQDDPHALVNAARRVLATTNAITQMTWRRQQDISPTPIRHKPDDMSMVRACELMLIQGKSAIEAPDKIEQGVIRFVQLP